MAISKLAGILHEQVRVGVGLLRDGGVVAIPTDTLYGLAACAFDARAVRRVFTLKGRPRGMALPLLLAEPDDIGRYASHVSDPTWALVERFMPGPLTLVLRKAPHIPDVVTAGMDTVALRVPDHPVPRALARALGAPITGTSANRSGQPALETAEAVRDEFGDDLDYVIDDDGTPCGLASTLLDLSGDLPRVLRPGAIALSKLAEVCGEVLAPADASPQGSA